MRLILMLFINPHHNSRGHHQTEKLLEQNKKIIQRSKLHWIRTSSPISSIDIEPEYASNLTTEAQICLKIVLFAVIIKSDVRFLLQTGQMKKVWYGTHITFFLPYITVENVLPLALHSYSIFIFYALQFMNYLLLQFLLIIF